MKITFVIHSLSSIGGAETILSNFANHFSSLNHHVTIIILSKDTINIQLSKTINIVQFTDSNKRKLPLPFAQISYICKIIQKEQPDILIGFVTSTNILTAFAGWIEKVPIILSEHTSYKKSLTTTRGALRANIWKILRRISYPLASKIFILTEEDKKYFQYLNSVEVIPNPLLLTNRHHDIKKENIILAVGRLHKIKGFDMLIKAFSLMKTKSWKLYIAGEGEEKSSLKKLVDELNLSNKITFLGFVQDMEYYYKKASIFVLSSRSEGFPGALCEAMGYGCSSIAFDCPTGPKEIIKDGYNGLLVEANNVHELSKQMLYLIQNPHRQKELSNAGKNIAKELNIDSISNRWIDAIQTSIENYKRG